MPERIQVVHRGEAQPFPIALTCTLGDLKDLVAARLFGGHSAADLRVVFRGRLLKDDAQRLVDAGVENDSRVMVVQGQGGPRPDASEGQPTLSGRLQGAVAWAVAALPRPTLRRSADALWGIPALAYDFVRTMFTDDGLVEGPRRPTVGIAIPGPH